MDNFIRLSGDENIIFFVNKIEAGIITNNDDFLMLKISQEKEFLLTVIPIQTTQEHSIGYVAKIEFIDNLWTTKNPNIIITKYTENCYKIFAKKIIVGGLVNENNITHYQKNSINITLSNTIPQLINFHNNSINNSIVLDFCIKNAVFEQFLEYYALSGTTSTAQQYLLLLDDKGDKILELCADKIEKNAQDITTLQLLKDVNGHGYVTNYNIKNNEIKMQKNYSVYLDNLPKKPASNYAVCWAFVEAINIGNIALARTFLSSELNTLLDDQHLNNFFGNYCEMEQNWLTDNQFIIWVIDADTPKKARPYTFDVKDAKIYNIVNND